MNKKEFKIRLIKGFTFDKNINDRLDDIMDTYPSTMTEREFRNFITKPKDHLGVTGNVYGDGFNIKQPPMVVFFNTHDTSKIKSIIRDKRTNSICSLFNEYGKNGLYTDICYGVTPVFRLEKGTSLNDCATDMDDILANGLSVVIVNEENVSIYIPHKEVSESILYKRGRLITENNKDDIFGAGYFAVDNPYVSGRVNPTLSQILISKEYPHIDVENPPKNQFFKYGSKASSLRYHNPKLVEAIRKDFKENTIQNFLLLMKDMGHLGRVVSTWYRDVDADVLEEFNKQYRFYRDGLLASMEQDTVESKLLLSRINPELVCTIQSRGGIFFLNFVFDGNRKSNFDIGQESLSVLVYFIALLKVAKIDPMSFWSCKGNNKTQQ